MVLCKPVCNEGTAAVQCIQSLADHRPYLVGCYCAMIVSALLIIEWWVKWVVVLLCFRPLHAAGHMDHVIQGLKTSITDAAVL